MDYFGCVVARVMWLVCKTVNDSYINMYPPTDSF